jgi:hypothetical protein
VRTFTEKLKTTQQTTSPKVTVPTRSRIGQRNQVHSILHLQRTIGNQTVQRLIESVTQQREQDTSEDDAIAQRIKAAAGSGRRLDPDIKRRLNEGLGADLSNARVHTDGEADRLAQSLNALAFTSGQDIFFRDGAYEPTSERGMRLLAHEAAHVAQQAAGPVAGSPAPGGVSISNPSDGFEQAATRAADAVVGGAPARRGGGRHYRPFGWAWARGLSLDAGHPAE